MSTLKWKLFGKAIAIPNSFHLSVDMFHPAARVDRPARRTVVVLAPESPHPRRLRGLAAHGDDLRARRLRVAALVPGAALQHRGAAVPLPRDAEPRERLAQHRLLERGLRPGLAAVGRDHDAGNAPVAGIRDE